MLKRLGAFLAVLLLSVSSLSVLSPMVVKAAGLNCTWTGASSDNFNTAGNWSSCGGGVPGAADNLVFSATGLTGYKTLTNNISSLSVATITFQNTDANFYGFIITGNALTVTTAINVTGGHYDQFSNNVVLGGNVALSATGANSSIRLSGVVSGTGNLTTTGTISLENDNTFAGTVTATSGSLAAEKAASLGGGSNAVTIGDGAKLQIGGCADAGFTLANNITLNGASIPPFGSYQAPKLTFGGSCAGGGGSFDEIYAQASVNDAQSYISSGTVTLGADATFGSVAKQVTLTGPFAGGKKFTLPNTHGGKLIVNSSANSSSMPNGTYTPEPVVATLTDSLPSATVLIGNNATVTINGVRGDTSVTSGGTLKGTGTVGALSVSPGGKVAPGLSPGCLNAGNTALLGSFDVEIGGTTACTGYDQLRVTGTVDVTNGTLNTSRFNGFKPAAGQNYVIIDNDGADAVTGTFTNLAQNATFTVEGYVFRVSYTGGTGNDVVLTVVSVPAAPDTGFALIQSNPLVSVAAMTIAGSGLLVVARRFKKHGVRR